MKKRDLSFAPDFPHSGDWLARSSSIWIAGVALFILIAGAAIFLGFRHFEAARNHNLVSDKITANLLADILMEHNNATVGILQSYAHRPLFVNAVKNKDVAGVHRHLFDLKKNGEIDLTFVTDKRGTLWANFPVFPEAIGKDLSGRDWYKGISSQWKPYVSTVFKLIVEDKPLAAAVCVPVIDEKERVIGILATSQRLGFIVDIIQRVPLSPGSDVIVIDQKGQILYSNKLFYQESITNYQFFPIIETALKEKRQQLEIRKPQENQQKEYLTVVPVGLTGWSVIIERSQSGIFRAELNRFIEFSAVSLLLFLLIIAILVYLRRVALFRKTEYLLQVEKKLRQSEEEFRIIFNNSSAAMAVIDGDTTILTVNKAYCKISQYEEQEVVGKSWTFQIPPEDRERLQEYNRKRFTDPQSVPAHYEFKFYRKDGVIRQASISVAIMPASNQIIASFDDITERKHSEEKIRKMQNILNDGQKIAHVGTFEYDAENKTTVWSEEEYRIYGFDPAESSPTYEDMLAKCIYPEDSDMLHKNFTNAMQNKSVYELEHRILRPDGSMRWVYDRALPYFDNDGKLLRYIGTTLDITERKHVEEELQFRSEIMTNITEAIYLVRMDDGVIVYTNSIFERMFGYAQDEMLGKHVSIVNASSEKNPEETAKEIMAEINNTGSWKGNVNNIKKDGTTFWCYANVSVFDHSKYGKVFVALHTDITARKHAEEDIIEQRNLSQKYLQIASVMIVALNSGGEITLINKKGLDILGYKDEQALVGKNWFEVVLPKSAVAEVMPVFHQLMAGDIQPVEYYENTVLTKNGEERILSFHNSLLHDKEGKISGILSSGEDITERKRAEEEIKASLLEKELLLKEIHHRVKNNLQIIASLLNMQGRYAEDEKLDGIFGECQDRIRAMASVHTLLYKSQNLAAIDFGEYIREMTGQLFRSYRKSNARISLVIHAEKVMLSIDEAIPCGLIINELVTNALKYAFPEARQGELKIEMAETQQGIRLLFKDNGIGFPQDLDFRNGETMGLKLVNMLVEQLDGTIEQVITDGTRYSIMFKPQRISLEGQNAE